MYIDTLSYSYKVVSDTLGKGTSVQVPENWSKLLGVGVLSKFLPDLCNIDIGNVNLFERCSVDDNNKEMMLKVFDLSFS